MAGIYIHIPFCMSRCIYCDFYSTTQGEKKQAYVAALTKELRLRADYLQQDGQMPPINTIYIGGGTPSALEPPLLKQILETVYATYNVSGQAEVTLEANPDDLSPQKIKSLCQLPINRISIGVQTFDNGRLRQLRRRHNGQQALHAIRDCQDAGFGNISIDLIYGLPSQSLEDWETDLDIAAELQVQHLSAYALIYEEGTPLWKMRKQYLVKEADEDLSLKMFNLLICKLEDEGFEHYEISNFSRPGFRSRHNSSYWKGIPYLGCGPSAHSFDGRDRQWNIPDLDTYIRQVGKCSSPEDFKHAPWIEREKLSLYERYNDCIITSLRTSDGLDLDTLKRKFGDELADYCLREASPHLQRGNLEICREGKEQSPAGLLKLTRQGIFLSDGIMSDLLYVTE